MSIRRFFSLSCLLMAVFFFALYGMDQLYPSAPDELSLVGEALKVRR